MRGSRGSLAVQKEVLAGLAEAHLVRPALVVGIAELDVVVFPETHQSGNALLRDRNAAVVRRGAHPWCAIGAARVLVQLRARTSHGNRAKQIIAQMICSLRAFLPKQSLASRFRERLLLAPGDSGESLEAPADVPGGVRRRYVSSDWMTANRRGAAASVHASWGGLSNGALVAVRI
jgi:hypothetical protein